MAGKHARPVEEERPTWVCPAWWDGEPHRWQPVFTGKARYCTSCEKTHEVCGDDHCLACGADT